MSKRGFKKAIQKAHTKFLKWAEANNLNFVLSSEMKKQDESSDEPVKKKKIIHKRKFID